LAKKQAKVFTNILANNVGFMSILGRSVRIAAATIASGILVLAVCFLVPRSGAPLLPEQSPPQTTQDTLHIYIAEYLYHTGLLLPTVSAVHDWRNEFSCLEVNGNSSIYAEFGWGDSTFYMGGQVTPSMALNALFASKTSVIGVIGLDAPPFFTEPASVQRISLTASNYAALVASLQRSILYKNASTIFLKQGFWGARSGFYAANTASTGQYSVVNNCNVWSAEHLRMAGMSTPLWSGLPQPLAWRLRREHH
jgi:uncharacterized protein (TIGR02117 family)